jgi:acyl-CoA thioesterase FadM
MNLLIRLFWIFFTQTRGRRAADPFAVTSVRSVALPNDIDLNGHVNNGRLMTYIDFGRLDWLYQIGALQLAYRRRFIPVIGDISVRFLRPLKAFERFTIESRVLGWSEHWAYFEHRLIKSDGRIALQLVNRGKFWSPRRGTLMVSEVIAGIGLTGTSSPELPAWVQTWVRSLDELKYETRAPQRAESSVVEVDFSKAA